MHGKVEACPAAGRGRRNATPSQHRQSQHRRSVTKTPHDTTQRGADEARHKQSIAPPPAETQRDVSAARTKHHPNQRHSTAGAQHTADAQRDHRVNSR